MEPCASRNGLLSHEEVKGGAQDGDVGETAAVDLEVNLVEHLAQRDEVLRIGPHTVLLEDSRPKRARQQRVLRRDSEVGHCEVAPRAQQPIRL